MMDCLRLQKFAEVKPPATKDELNSVQSELALPFPTAYIELLLCSNGLKAGDGSNSLKLDSTHELTERNRTYQVARFAPSLLLIGDDGGDIGIFVSPSGHDSPVYLIGLGSMQIEDGQVLSVSFREWIARGLVLVEDRRDEYPEFVDVYLIRVPQGGTYELLRLKYILNLSTSVAALQKVLNRLPWRLLRSVPFWKYAQLVLLYNIQDPCLALFEVDEHRHPVRLPSMTLR